MTYRGVMLIQAVRLLLLPFVLLSAWLSIEKNPGNPYSDADYLLYYLMVPLIMNLTNSQKIFRFPQAVKDGSLSRDLLKPFPPVLIFVIDVLTSNLVQLIYLFPITAICIIIFNSRLPSLQIGPVGFFIFLMAILAGLTMRIMVSGSIALLGFWIEDVTTLNLVLNGGIWALLGGMIVPVATFPESIRRIASYLPYRYMLSFPIEILSGKLSASEIFSGFLVIAAWSCVLFFLIKFIWKSGLKTFTAYGG
ncbi:MAG: hypothetical protein Kow0029_05460 [Candidatus Rifleibacteriota bacterium]